MSNPNNQQPVPVQQPKKLNEADVKKLVSDKDKQIKSGKPVYK